MRDRLLYSCSAGSVGGRGRFATVLGVAAAEGTDQRHTSPVRRIRVAVVPDEVAFFELDRDEDVGGRRDGEYQMGDRHRRSGPESEQPAEIQRMPDEPVGTWSHEAQ